LTQDPIQQHRVVFCLVSFNSLLSELC